MPNHGTLICHIPPSPVYKTTHRNLPLESRLREVVDDAENIPCTLKIYTRYGRVE